VRAATVGAPTCFFGAPSLASRSGAAATGSDTRAFTPAGYVPETLAVKTPGRLDRAGTNVKGNIRALHKYFIRDWDRCKKSYFDQSRKARGRRAIGVNPFQVSYREFGKGNRRAKYKISLKFHEFLTFRDPCYET